MYCLFMKLRLLLKYLIIFLIPLSVIQPVKADNNYIYYSDIKDDKYYKKIGFFKRGKGALKINLTNYSYIVKSANKDYVNYIYIGEVQYLSPDQSKNYLNKIDGKKIKSDDL